jgi:hypothetical protein
MLSPLRYHNALGFLSKHPLTDTEFDLFSANVKLEKVMGTKGALITTMALPNPSGGVDLVKVCAVDSRNPKLPSRRVRVWVGGWVRGCVGERGCVVSGVQSRSLLRPPLTVCNLGRGYIYLRSWSTSTSRPVARRTPRMHRATLFARTRSKSAWCQTQTSFSVISTLGPRRLQPITSLRSRLGERVHIRL